MSVTKKLMRPFVWRLRVEGPTGPDGKRTFTYRTVKGSEKEAELEVAKLRVQQAVDRAAAAPSPEAREAPQADVVTVGGFAVSWIEARAALGSVTYVTAEHYRYMIDRFIVPTWGAVALADLSRPMVVTGLAKIAQAGTGPRTLRHIKSRLGSLLKDAARDGLAVSLTATQDIPMPAAPRTAGKLLTAEQQRVLLRFAASDRLGPEIRFALSTGARRGEIAALVVGDVDITQGTIRVDKALARGAGTGRFLKGPKSEAGRRTIALPKAMLIELEQIVEERTRAAARLSLPAAEMPLFVSMAGEGWAPAGLGNATTRFMKRAGLEGFSLHKLRHSHASLLLRGKNNPRAVSARLGHSDPSVTMQVYAHCMPEDDTTLAAAIGRAMEGF